MRYFFLFILIFVTYSAQAQDNIVFNLNILTLGGGVNVPIIKDYPMEGHISVLGVGIEDRNKSIGVGFSPFLLYTVLPEEVGFNNKTSSSFLNLNVYKNFINKNLSDSKIFYLGPFGSVNYMFFDDALYWNKCIFTAGIELGIRERCNKFNYNIWSLETGYRNINGNSKFYAGFKIDIVAISVIRFWSWLNSF